MIESSKVTNDFAQIDSVNCVTDRVASLIELRKNAVEHICCERSRIVTDSWKSTYGQNIDIRRAKLFRQIMRENPISIWPGELIVGSQSQYVLGASPYVDYSPDSAIENLNTMGPSGGSSVTAAMITEEERRSILEDCEFWHGHSTGDIVREVREAKFPWLPDWIESGLVMGMKLVAPPGVRTVDYGKVIRIGLEGVIDEAKEALDNLPYETDSANDYLRDCFLQAVIIACEGAIEYAQRYSVLAAEMAAKEADPVRRAELEEISQICAHVPAKPARSFREAVQSFWFIHLCLNLEMAFHAETPGRLDQYLYPMYRKDVMVEQTLSRQDAAEIVACLFVKFNQLTSVKSNYDKKNIPGTHLQNTTICGVDRDGNDASNELSYLLLETLAQVQFPQPPIYVRYHKNIDRKVWLKALEVNVRRGDGNPSILSDEPRIPSFVDHGITLEDARDWCCSGCAGSITSASIHGGSLGVIDINTAKIFEYVLNEGREPKNGKQIGPKTGDPSSFTCIEDYVEAFKAQFDVLIKILVHMSHLTAFADINSYRIPFCSALCNDCIKLGKDVRNGGQRYQQFLFHVADRGIQDVVDSLAAIKKVVFDDKIATIDEIKAALKANFEGYEELRDRLLAAPKYGNDDDYVDCFYSELAEWCGNRIRQEKDPFGFPQWAGRSGANTHLMFGKVTGALPDGRKAETPLADGFCSPEQGCDIHGPTCVFNSAGKANVVANSNAALMNMKFEHKLFEDGRNIDKLAALLENFFNKNGYHVQINFIDKETLENAQKRPEDYSNLMVRVAGYSAFFVDLPTRVQDDIISRTSQDI
ncbi:MAG: hypothetical protein IKG67_01015 [Parasporobacterium sp.]|nr:hypothetical protein [Parasporobacterium sp.]